MTDVQEPYIPESINDLIANPSKMEDMILPPDTAEFLEETVKYINGDLYTFMRMKVGTTEGWYLTNTTASRYSATLFSIKGKKLSFAMVPSMRTSAAPKIEKKYKLGKYGQMQRVRMMMENYGIKFRYIQGTYVIVPLVIGLFCRDTSFATFYMDYVRNPDAEWMYDPDLEYRENAAKDTPDKIALDYINGIVRDMGGTDFVRVENTKNANEFLEYQALMVALCSVKSFAGESSGDNNHFLKFAESRLSSFYNKLGVRLSSPQVIISGLHSDSFLKMSNHMSFYPNLKKKIYGYLLDSNSGELGAYAKVILAESQATVYNLIAEFLRDGPKTQAHFMPRVAVQINKFVDSYEAIKRDIGDNIQYIRLLNPDEPRIANSNWPLLAQMAVVYKARDSTNRVTLRNLKSVKKEMPTHILNMMSCEVSDNFIVADRRETGELSELAQKYLGLTGVTPQTPVSFKPLNNSELNDYITTVASLKGEKTNANLRN